MARITSTENRLDPATGRPLPAGVSCRGPGQYRARRLIDGSRVTRTFDTARQAREWLEDTGARVRAGEYRDLRPLDQLLVQELVQRYADERMQDRPQDRGHLPAILGDDLAGLKLSRATPAAVRAFRDRQLAGGKSPATVVKRLNLLQAVFQHAMAEWDVPLTQNPASGRLVRRPTGADQKRARRLVAPPASAVAAARAAGEDEPRHELDRLLAAVAASPVPDDVWLVRWSIEQATRLGEALRLTWADVDLDARLISLGRTKSMAHAEERGPEVRPLMPGARAVLLEKLAGMVARPEPAEAVFGVGGDKAFSVRYGRLVKRAGIEDLTFHDLRHEATSRLARLFPNPLDLRRVTGHRDLKSLDRYYQPCLSTLASEAAERARILGDIYQEENG